MGGRIILGCMMAGLACVSLACTNGEGDEPNALPEPPSADASTSAGPTTSEPMTTTGLDTGAGSGSGDMVELPATYRFDCIDIQGVGDADGTAFQAQVLENTWSADIANFKLNILLEVASRNEAGGAVLGIRSGVGPEAAGMCTQPDTISDLIDVVFATDDVRWGPADGIGECSVPTTGTTGNTYTMELGAERVVYIYAEDDDTTTFNCTPDQATPDAVPIRAVQAEVSTNPEETRVWGTLNGCLLESEATQLCSCLGECAGEGPDDLQTEGACAGCPVGGNPLNVLLGGVNPSPNCTDALGEPALDLKIGFAASRLPDVPTACGG